MPTTHVAKYPIVDPNPSWGRIITNFNLSDYAAISGFTIAGFSTGFFGGLISSVVSHLTYIVVDFISIFEIIRYLFVDCHYYCVSTQTIQDF